nr:immunoglobulin heavy chain junction region [Macaca mulatta]MPN69347.1 immunoglobulin heavy chain junction region [Macaca mulatta]MPN69675.1 immunoglobulin heavy chain junction region [Macaca mulatta]MPN69745.1 immunoglobulin heavy chain junction region [Macaca mulatta]MPN69982.1 immunoglobulin heavy chain junction region [Macaca mulatta]
CARDNKYSGGWLEPYFDSW